MALLERTTEVVSMGNYVTIAQAAKIKHVEYHAVRMWLRNHPEVPIMRLGKNVLVRIDELDKYRPYKVRVQSDEH